MARLTKKIGLVLISGSTILAGCSESAQPQPASGDFLGGPSGSGALAGTGSFGTANSSGYGGHVAHTGGWFGGSFFGAGRSNGSYGGYSGGAGAWRIFQGWFRCFGSWRRMMQRLSIGPRSNWPKIVESQGMYFHSEGGVPYWDENAYYSFTSAEVDAIEAATYELDKMCLAAVEHVFQHSLLDRFHINPIYHDLLHESWEHDEQTIYGRFDLAFREGLPPKLLEYNADTPTAILEAAVIQWHWLQDLFPGGLQFNSIHERLFEVFQLLRQQTHDRFYFTATAGCIEDYMTVNYLRDVAIQAGFDTAYIDIEKIGWHALRHSFTDLGERPIKLCFKLYPWEWMEADAFGPKLRERTCRWFEAPWKSLLSNKAILAILCELFPESPYLLRTSREPLAGGNYVRKPLLGREGANIAIYEAGNVLFETDGPYDGPWVYQENCPLPRFDGKHFALVGSWIVNGWACGLGIREDESPITGNLSRFVPHIYAG